MNILKYLRKEANKIFLHCSYDISNNTLAQREKVHEWKNHIHESIEQIWNQLSEESRLVALIMAEDRADKEEWD